MFRTPISADKVWARSAGPDEWRRNRRLRARAEGWDDRNRSQGREPCGAFEQGREARGAAHRSHGFGHSDHHPRCEQGPAFDDRAFARHGHGESPFSAGRGREFGGGGHDFGGGREFGGGGGRGRFGGGARGGLRMFAPGDLRFVILRLLENKPSHGYELIKEIGDRMGGGYAPSPGVVYPMLTMLEELGHATVTAEGSRKLYSITDEGKKALDDNRTAVDALFARMERLRSEQQSGPAQQIERAVMNFRMALRMKQGPLTTEQIHAITDIIDAAARQIERL